LTVAKSDQTTRPDKMPALKVLYLLGITAAVFALPAFAGPRATRWIGVLALCALQLVALIACRVKAIDIVRPVWRLKWLFLVLIAAYTLFPAEGGSANGNSVDWPLPLLGWRISVNLLGLGQAGLMCLQIATVILASSIVRLTGSGNDLVEGLKAFRLPHLFVYSLDRTLGLLGERRPRGVRRNRSSRTGFFTVLKRLLRGEVGELVQSIRRDLDRAGEDPAAGGAHGLSARLARDVAVVSGIALTMASFKMVKILPGVPFASGHKALLLFPLYVLAARLTTSRWGATAAGSVMGVIGFLQGDGRFGILEMLKNVAPGVVIDLAEPLARRLPRWALGYCLLGLAAAIARTASEFALVILLGARAEIYIFPMAKLIPNLVAGFLSGFATIFVLRAFERVRAQQPDAQLALLGMRRDEETLTPAVYLDGLPDDLAPALVEHTASRPSELSSIDVWALGGAMRREPEGGSAFARRNEPYLLGIEANWEDPADDEANIAWVRGIYRDMGRFSSGATYLNFAGFGEEDRPEALTFQHKDTIPTVVFLGDGADQQPLCGEMAEEKAVFFPELTRSGFKLGLGRTGRGGRDRRPRARRARRIGLCLRSGLLRLRRLLLAEPASLRRMGQFFRLPARPSLLLILGRWR